MRETALALGIGALGGTLFWLLRLPLPWMLGSMTGCIAASVMGLRMGVPRWLRSSLIVVLGVMLGSSFTPDIFGRVAQWSLTLAGLAGYVLLAGGATYLYLRRVAGYGPITSFFTAMPGGLNEMVLVGGAMGGDPRLIALTHGARIMLVVFLLVFGFRIFGGYHPTGEVGGGTSILTQPPLEMAILVACGTVGALIAVALRWPSAPLLGAMMLSGIIHLLGITEGRPPFELVAIAQIAMGSAVGSRFAGVKVSTIAMTTVHALAATVIMLAAAVGCAWALHAATGLPVPSLLLAYAPGGLAEMSLVALALGADAAFVATHHICRILMVVSVAPPFFRRVGGGRKLPSERPAEDD
ncbi:MAG: AbrB family transcriptional regulator [Alphaproteobacteria bacterium]|nr:AbrB family transcriptional regulator [Alphaproteobacteria bacterium]